MLTVQEREILRGILGKVATPIELFTKHGIKESFVKRGKNMPPPVFRRGRFILYDVEQVQIIYTRVGRSYHMWLPSENRKLFYLRERCNLPWRKIGRELGVSESAAISRYKYLQKRGFDPKLGPRHDRKM